MRVWIVQRPIGKGEYKNVAAYFTRGAARTACVPNFDDRVVEGCCYAIEKPVTWHVGGKCKPAKEFSQPPRSRITNAGTKSKRKAVRRGKK